MEGRKPPQPPPRKESECHATHGRGTRQGRVESRRGVTRRKVGLMKNLVITTKVQGREHAT